MNTKTLAITLGIALGAMPFLSEVSMAHDVVETRQFSSAPDAVWAAWTDADLIRQWWGPVGFTAPKVVVDFRVEGASLVCMQAEGTPLMCNTWTYSAIEAHREISFDSRFASETGESRTAADLGLPPGIPDIVPHRISFEATADGGTIMTVTETGYLSAAAADLSKQGMAQVLDKMQGLIP